MAPVEDVEFPVASQDEKVAGLVGAPISTEQSPAHHTESEFAEDPCDDMSDNVEGEPKHDVEPRQPITESIYNPSHPGLFKFRLFVFLHPSSQFMITHARSLHFAQTLPHRFMTSLISPRLNMKATIAQVQLTLRSMK